MTDDDLAIMKCMWDAGYTAKSIAGRLNYSTSNVLVTAHRHRDMFPRRQKRIPDSVKELWIARIRAGRVQPYQVARRLGVTKTAVYQWLRKARKKEDE